MAFVRSALLAAAIGLSTVGGASAAERANLRFYWVVDQPVVVAIDGASRGRLPAQNIEFFTVSPGHHVITATLADGTSAKLAVDLALDQQAQSRGRSWWCVAGRGAPPDVRLIVIPTAGCKEMADGAPQDDDPAGR